jgi:hypothetical protein
MPRSRTSSTRRSSSCRTPSTPWAVRWEEAITRDLIVDDEKYFAEFLLTALLRGDNAARSAYYTQRFNIGTISRNEIRALENENPIEGGDTYYIHGADGAARRGRSHRSTPRSLAGAKQRPAKHPMRRSTMNQPRSARPNSSALRRARGRRRGGPHRTRRAARAREALRRRPRTPNGSVRGPRRSTPRIPSTHQKRSRRLADAWVNLGLGASTLRSIAVIDRMRRPSTGSSPVPRSSPILPVSIAACRDRRLHAHPARILTLQRLPRNAA